jgi:hypothetical protein
VTPVFLLVGVLSWLINVLMPEGLAVLVGGLDPLSPEIPPMPAKPLFLPPPVVRPPDGL